MENDDETLTLKTPLHWTDFDHHYAYRRWELLYNLEVRITWQRPIHMTPKEPLTLLSECIVKRFAVGLELRYDCRGWFEKGRPIGMILGFGIQVREDEPVLEHVGSSKVELGTVD